MFVGRDPIHLGQPLVCPHVSELPIEDGQAYRGHVVVRFDFGKLPAGGFFALLELCGPFVYPLFHLVARLAKLTFHLLALGDVDHRRACQPVLAGETDQLG